MEVIKVIAFDCDGVLFDTEEANRAYYNDILANFGLPEMSAEQFEYSQMHTADEAITYLFEEPDRIKAARAFRRRNGYDPYIKYMKMDPDLIFLLEKYQGRYGIAVATNRADTMNKVLVEHGIAQYFDLVVTALDVPRPKPHPDPLNRVVEHFKTSPEEVLYVGDSKLDELAARSAGVYFVSCRNSSLDADYHIQQLKEIDNILNTSHE